jgi:hemolysin activation/secretion protein
LSAYFNGIPLLYATVREGAPSLVFSDGGSSKIGNVQATMMRTIIGAPVGACSWHRLSQIVSLFPEKTSRSNRWFKASGYFCFGERIRNAKKHDFISNILTLTLAAILTLMWMAELSQVRAQTTPSAGQLTPKSFEPQFNPQQPHFSFTPSETKGAPPGADKASLTIGKAIVEGGDPKYAERTEAILAAVRGHKLSISAFYEAANEIQQLYSEAGYFLIRVVIPPQDVKNGGALKFTIIDGFIEAVDIVGLAPQLKRHVAKTLAPLIGRRHLKRDVFDRALLLAADTPGLDLKSNLAPAKADYGVVLTVEGVYRPLSAQVTADNSLSKSLGVFTSTFSVAANSLFGLGEQFYVSATGAPNNGFMSDTSPRRLAAAGVTMPIGYDGLSSNIEYAWSTTMPLIGPGMLATNSNYERLSFKLSYPLVKTENSTISTRIGFDATNETNRATVFNAILYDDSLRTLRGGLDFNGNYIFGTTVNASMDLSRGIGGLGSRGAGNATVADPISQAGASDQFSKLSLRFLVHQNLPDGFGLELAGRGQYAATGPLMNSEKFTLGGPADLSAYDASYFVGDHGWLLRGELQYNYQTQWIGSSLSLKPYIFAARGEVFTINPTAAELAVNGADSFGLGLRWALPVSYPVLKQIDVAFEGARQLSDTPTAVPNSWRFNFSSSMRF